MNSEMLKVAGNNENVIITQHGINRLREKQIKYRDVIAVLLNGEIIEQYPDDYPYPSCLVFGHSQNGRVLHVVCGYNEGKIWIITAYWPDNERWEPDMKTRKGRK